jgi:hypothetical protein
VFICTGAGTTASSEPSWSTPPYPTLGTVFTDGGGVQWTTFGTQPGAFPPIVQLPVDSDPPLAYAIVLEAQTIANQLAWLTSNAGILGSSNTWTNNNTFNSATDFLDGIQVANYTATQAAIIGNEDPTSATRLFLQEWRLATVSGSVVYGRLYADTVSSVTGNCQLTLTINARWNGTLWVQDSTADVSTVFGFGDGNFFIGAKPAGTSPWSSFSAKVVLGLGTTDPNLGLTVPIGAVNSVETVGQYGANTTVASAGFINSVTSAQTLATINVPLAAAQLFRVDVYALDAYSNAISPVVTLDWYDPGGLHMNSITVPLVLQGNMASTDFLWTGSFVIGAENGHTLAVTGAQSSHGETVSTMWAAITAIA